MINKTTTPNNNHRTIEPSNHRTILLAHGSGGKLTHDLIKCLFARYFKNDYLAPLSDSAEITLSGTNIAFTTDSYVVKPLKFPGGDIGKLSICGTVNDLTVVGATPLFISCGFIIEEGFSLDTLEEIVASMAKTAADAGVQIVTGDTKVVEKGAADGLFINTAGIGVKIDGLKLGCGEIEPGDKIIINGNIGDHGMAVMAARGDLGLSSNLKSDCAPLNGLVSSLFTNVSSPHIVCHPHPSCHPRESGDPEQISALAQNIKFMRDPTRGGLVTTLCEVAGESGYDIEIDERTLPISDEVKGIAEILGIDPLFSANEGKVIIIVSPNSAEEVLGKMRIHPLGKNAQIIGEVKSTRTGRINLKTEIGTLRQLTMLTGNQLPRIC